MEKDLTKKQVEQLLHMLYISRNSKLWSDYEYAKDQLPQWTDEIALWVSDYIGV